MLGDEVQRPSKLVPKDLWRFRAVRSPPSGHLSNLLGRERCQLRRKSRRSIRLVELAENRGGVDKLSPLSLGKR